MIRTMNLIKLSTVLSTGALIGDSVQRECLIGVGGSWVRDPPCIHVKCL